MAHKEFRPSSQSPREVNLSTNRSSVSSLFHKDDELSSAYKTPDKPIDKQIKKQTNLNI